MLNKIDRLLPSEPAQDNSGLENVLAGLGVSPDENTVIVSAVKGWGLPRILEMIAKAIPAPSYIAPLE